MIFNLDNKNKRYKISKLLIKTTNITIDSPDISNSALTPGIGGKWNLYAYI